MTSTEDQEWCAVRAAASEDRGNKSLAAFFWDASVDPERASLTRAVVNTASKAAKKIRQR